MSKSARSRPEAVNGYNGRHPECDSELDCSPEPCGVAVCSCKPAPVRQCRHAGEEGRGTGQIARYLLCVRIALAIGTYRTLVDVPSQPSGCDTLWV